MTATTRQSGPLRPPLRVKATCGLNGVRNVPHDQQANGEAQRPADASDGAETVSRSLARLANEYGEAGRGSANAG